jgi:hypothetical protein
MKLSLVIPFLTVAFIFAASAAPAFALDAVDKAEEVVDDVKDKVEEEHGKLTDIPLMPHAWAIPVVVVLGLLIGFVVGKRSGAKQQKAKG